PPDGNSVPGDWRWCVPRGRVPCPWAGFCGGRCDSGRQRCGRPGCPGGGSGSRGAGACDYAGQSTPQRRCWRDAGVSRQQELSTAVWMDVVGSDAFRGLGYAAAAAASMFAYQRERKAEMETLVPETWLVFGVVLAVMALFRSVGMMDGVTQF